jgi:hypothetical protein
VAQLGALPTPPDDVGCFIIFEIVQPYDRGEPAVSYR